DSEGTVNDMEVFPILQLPSELSFKILSYVGAEELRVCRYSLALDKVHFEWNKGKKIDDMTINLFGKHSNMICARYENNVFCSTEDRVYARMRVFNN
ncbi:hypothetical protein PFISCL1PPCAC_21890, partial [Pristionchus fissidentatus]